MLVLGDAHAADPDNRAALLDIYDATNADVALQVGDLEWYDLPVETWFIAGNNEDFDVIDALRDDAMPDVNNVHLLASTATDLQGLRVAGLSGNYAPTKYDLPRSELEGDRRRHFTRDDVERLAAIEDIDVLVIHEAPKGLLYYGYDPGCEHVNDLLDTTDPELCLIGHYHRHEEAEILGCRVVSLAPAWERYYTLNSADLTIDVHETPG
ncbi:metallophosphoesterase family protein [Halocatena salina]|uniref:Metallophosphoesterase n=1 Tax=Halocatena salina TaxID=2934340 RepID=A0A8U0A6L2_9EURY|nr:metallophosphoesterase [Halocatena salina]UPM44654.1 metallophosphoesterase [Halocatena salina]